MIMQLATRYRRIFYKKTPTFAARPQVHPREEPTLSSYLLRDSPVSSAAHERLYLSIHACILLGKLNPRVLPAASPLDFMRSIR